MRLAWATDIHLDHATESARRRFCRFVNEQADALVVTGDIAESHVLGSALTALASLTERPVYFVLGNHDYYHLCKAQHKWYYAKFRIMRSCWWNARKSRIRSLFALSIIRGARRSGTAASRK